MAQYLVIKNFKDGNSRRVYDRLHDKGQFLPEGLYFVASWLCASDARCFQLVETEHRGLLDAWTAAWDDLIDFEIAELKHKPLPEPETME